MTGKLVRIYDEHSEQVNCCHFTNNSNHLLLATGSNDYFLKVSVNENHVGKFDRYIRTSPVIFFSYIVLIKDLLVIGIETFVLA